MDSIRSAHPRPKNLAEKFYRITGTDVSFSANTNDFDEKAVKTVNEINRMGRHGVEVHDDLLEMEPQHITGDLLFCTGVYGCLARLVASMSSIYRNGGNGEWKLYSQNLGYGVWQNKSGYTGFKTTYVYHKGNRKTNWFMNTYSAIDNNTIQADGFRLCHVFQSDGKYDPSPKHVPSSFDFNQLVLNSRAAELEDLIANPEAFEDFGNPDKNSGVSSTQKPKGKRSEAWKTFTEIEVLGPDGVVLTLAICHGCNVAYKTGGLKPKEKGSTELVFSYNGTNTMMKHSSKCCGQPHIAGNPYGAPNQQML